MRTFEEIAVDASPERAWEAVVDFKGRMAHSSRVKGAEILGGGELEEGARLRLQIDNDSFTMTVIEMLAPSRLALEFRAPLIRGSHVYSVFADGDWAKVRIDAHYGGLLGTVFGALTKGKMKRDLRDELAAIKAQAGAGVTPSPGP